MSLIHIARNNAVLGQFTEDDVRAGLAAGTYLTTDLAWRAGQAQWKPLGEWPEFFPQADGPPPVTFEPVESFDTPAWENRNGLNWITAYVATVKQILVAPGATFARMQPAGGIGAPFLFYLMGQIPAALASAAATMINPTPFDWMKTSAASHSASAPHTSVHFQNMGNAFGGLFCAPIILFIYSLILHLMLMLWRAQKEPYAATFRAYAYTSGAFAPLFIPLNLMLANNITAAISLMAMLPLVIWMCVLQIISLAKVHRVSAGRVTGAYLTPIVFCCCAYAVLLFGFFGMAAAFHR